VAKAEEASDLALCNQHSMKKRSTSIKIYDTFIFNDELDMLEVKTDAERSYSIPCVCHLVP
jgi:hypothetical protein